MKGQWKKVYQSEIYGDCTSRMIFEPLEKITVQEMCDWIINESDEWGYIGIKCPGTIFGNPCVEYYHGHYVNRNRDHIEFKFPPHIANAVIKRLEWHGGWSNGDWLFAI